MKITVVSPTAIWPNTHALAIQKTLEALPVHAKGLLISHVKPSISFNGEWAPITKDWIPRGEWNIHDYSRFILFGLVDYIDTDFCITVQHDGYAVNRHNWDNEFLGYDYIGAPWPITMNPARVGNGGFSLRSKRWLKVSSQTPCWNGMAEDDWCCRVNRSWIEKRGVRIAPISVAMRWSVEHRIEEYPHWDTSKSFGFHGFFAPGSSAYRLVKE